MNNKYFGMTVNERLYLSGLMDEFDIAVKDKKIDKVISILKKVDLEDEGTVNSILMHFGLKLPSE
ncbi:MAG: hypothetical protein WCK60_03735 [Candidatus Nomurabacteria bacterium]